MNTDIHSRIHTLRKRKDMTLEELGTKVGVAKATVQRYESGEIPNIKRQMIEKLAQALGTTPAYLMGWADDEQVYTNIEPLPVTHQVPLIGMIACGEPILAEENIEDYVTAPEHVQADFALRCKGDSMINARIYDGDLVYIRAQPNVDNGEIAAVLIDDEATLKKVFLRGNTLILQPENTEYEPFIFVGEEINDIRIIGKAVAFLSSIG